MLLFSFSFSSIDPRYELLVNQNIHYCKKKGILQIYWDCIQENVVISVLKAIIIEEVY